MRPFLVSKVWGGRALADQWKKHLPDDAPYGESWEVADLPEGQSTIANGDLEGRPLSHAVAEWGADLIGNRAMAGDGAFPLLVKILDANADLSVQVHPGPGDLQRLPGARSKDEAWVILDSDDGSILHGFRDGVGAEEFARAVGDKAAESALRRVYVTPGEVYRVAPGTVHAICAGVQLLEVQQPSDTTYRVWDYDRPGLDGKPRELHLENAYSVMRYEADAVPTAKLGDEICEPLLQTDHYSIAHWSLDGPERTWRFDDTSPTVVFVLKGEVEIGGVIRSRGETAVVPACITEVAASGRGEVIIARA